MFQRTRFEKEVGAKACPLPEGWKYLLLPKHPRLLAQWSTWLNRQGCELPENIWLGTSTSSSTQRLRWRSLLEARGGGSRFLSIEPPVEIPPEAFGRVDDRQKIT